MKKLVTLFLVLCLLLTTVGALAEVAPKAEHPVLKVLMAATAYDPNTTIESQVIENATGYHVEYFSLPSENPSNALMLAATTDEYDVLMTSRVSDFTTLKANHALLPLNSYIDAIAPELWDYIPASAWSGVSDEDGNVYALPKLYTIDTEVASFLTVRMDLVRAAGIEELPTTIGGFTEMLRTLKDYYKDEYIILTGPYNKGTVGNQLNIPLCIASAFGIYNDWMVDDDGNVIYMTEHKNFPAFIEYMNGLVKDNILDSDYAVNSFTETDSRISSGRAIISMGSRETITTVRAALAEIGVSTDDLEWIGALHDDDGNAVVMQTSQYSTYTMIPALKSDNAADVINWIKLKVENQEIINLGEENVHFTWDETGYPNPIQPAFTDERNKASVYVNFAKMDTFKVLFAARLRKDAAMWKAYTEATIAANTNEPEIFIPAYFAYNNSDVYAENNGVLYNDLNDYLLQLISGTKTLDDSLSTFTADWRNNGGEEVRAALTEWYQKNFK